MNKPLRVLLWRGLRRRCPRCGERDVFSGYFTLRPRCPRCNLLFEREEGAFLGAYVINFGVGEGLVAVLLMVFLFVKLNNRDVPLAPWLISGAILAVGVPVLFYPHSRTIWAAIDLAMNPRSELEPDELGKDGEHG